MPKWLELGVQWYFTLVVQRFRNWSPLPANFWMTLQFCTQGPWGAHSQKNFTPFSSNSYGSWSIFSLYGDPQGPSGKIIVNCTTSRKQNFEILRKIDFFRVTRNRCLPKMLATCAMFLSITGPKFSPVRWNIIFLRDLKKIGQPKPRNSFFPQNGGENYFRFQFSAIFVFSTLDLVDLAKNRKNFSRGTFSRYLRWVLLY